MENFSVNMNRTLKRPMFRIGGSAGTGITSGLDTTKPRQEYKNAGMAELVTQTRDSLTPEVRASYQPYMERPKGEAASRFLTSFGLDLMSRPSAGSGFGGLLTTAAQSAKEPTARLYEDIDSRRLSKNAAEADLFKTLLQGNIDIASEAAGNEGGAAIGVELQKVEKIAELIPKIYEIKNKMEKGEASEEDEINLTIFEKQLNNIEKRDPITQATLDIYVNSIDGEMLFSKLQKDLLNKDNVEGGTKYGGDKNNQQLRRDILDEIKSIVSGIKSNRTGQADGGRTGYQIGGGVDMAQDPMMMPQDPMTMDQGSMNDGKNNLISYDQLRARLPAEITDDIVELMSNSAEALEDFATISSQQDVTQFNKKYSVNLVLPSEA